MNPSKLKQLQTEVEVLVDSLLPEGVRVLSRNRGNIANDIQIKLSKMGIAAITFPPAITKVNASVARAVVAEVAITIRLTETPLSNKTGVDIYQALEAILAGCHQARVGDSILYIGNGNDESPAEGSATVFSQTLTCKIEIKKP